MREYRQINLEEREKIYIFLKGGRSITEIATELGRHRSSISREIYRNQHARLGYLPDRASKQALSRKNRRISKLEKHPHLKAYVLDKLSEDKWSPEMIAGRLKLERSEVTISHEAIYQYIYSHRGQKLKLYQSLMYARPKRQLKISRKFRYNIPEQYKIQSRPDSINLRKEFGHFEGDLTFFKGSRNGSLTVLVERLSRKSFLIKNTNKTSDKVMLKITKMMQQLPQKQRKSITFDNGGEFKKFGLLSLIGTKAYFCKPASPWQKGQVERTNAIMHKFIPKKTKFNNINDKMILDAQNKLNNLPKKILNFLTPNELWNKYKNNNVALHT